MVIQIVPALVLVATLCIAWIGGVKPALIAVMFCTLAPGLLWLAIVVLSYFQEGPESDSFKFTFGAGFLMVAGAGAVTGLLSGGLGTIAGLAARSVQQRLTRGRR